MVARHNPIRVLWVNHRDPRHPSAGGAEEYLWNILSRLNSPTFVHTLLCERPDNLPKCEVIGNVRVVRTCPLRLSYARKLFP